MWSTSDGRTLQRLEADAFDVTGRGALTAVTVDAEGVAWAVGWGAVDAERTLLLFRSRGNDWQQVGLDAAVFASPLSDEDLTDVFVHNGRLHLLGAYADGVALWMADVADL